MIIYDHNPIQRYRAYKILLIIIHSGWILLTSQDVSFLFLPRWDISKLQTARDGRVAGLVCEVLDVSYLDPVKCWKKMELGGWDYFWRIFLYSVPELMRESLSCIGQSVAQSVSGVAANIFKTSFEDRWFHAVSCVFFLSILWKSLVTVGPQQRCFSPCPGAGCGACGETGLFEGDDMILEYCWGAYCRWRNSPRLFFCGSKSGWWF
jgi:hypothetical protein